MATLYITHPIFLEHTMGRGHPERPDRLRAIDTVLEQELFESLQREKPGRADFDLIERVHAHGYVEAIRKSAPSEGEIHLDGDTLMSPASLEAAQKAVGAGLRAVDAVMNKEAKTAFCAVRPPGHHAEPRRAMGFCIFNNIAIASLYARDKYGAERVAVVDFDVHHGNGTQAAFWSDKNLFLASTHQMPLYPGTGRPEETGIANNIVNVPLNAGSSGEHFRDAFKSAVLPALSRFSPDIILISAGFDGHRDDPLSSINLVEEDYAWATYHILEVAGKYAEGRVISLLEGGYDLRALAQSVGVHVKALIEGGC
jgi:acetoin utilization deacetylase AcuC-like enzyme